MGIWGAAYKSGDVEQSLVMLSSAASAAAEVPFALSRHLSVPHPHVHSLNISSPLLSATALPRAQEHPLFYVGIYALIGVATGLTNLSMVTAQFVGGYRASRLLFKRLLVTVTRATMRWHVSNFQFRWPCSHASHPLRIPLLKVSSVMICILLREYLHRHFRTDAESFWKG